MNYYVGHFNCGVVVDKPTEKEKAMFSRVWSVMYADIKRKEPLSYSRPRHYKKNYYTIKNPLSLSECN